MMRQFSTRFSTRRRARAAEESSLDMTPMLDVVFIMLIFFIVSASFVRESGLDVARPLADSAIVQKSAGLVVAISADNVIWLNRRIVAVGALRAQIERLHAENPSAGAVIAADARADTGTLVQVMDALRLAGVEKIAIAADKKEAQ